MKILMARLVSSAVLLVGICAAQSAGNLPVYTGSGTAITPVANEVHSTAFTSPTLQTLVTACGTTSPCNIVLDPSTTAITIPAATTIGSATQAVTVEDRGVPLECTGTSGADCIDIAEWGHLVCAGEGSGAQKSGCLIYASSTAKITSMVTNSDHTGAQSNFQFGGFSFNAPTAATISDGMLWIVAVEGKGHVWDLGFAGIASTTNLLLQDGPSTGANGSLVFDNVASACGGASGCIPISIVSGTTSTGVTGNILFNGGSAVDTGAGSGCVNGSGCLVNIDGPAGGTGHEVVMGLTFNDFYLETSGTSTSGDMVDIRNGQGVQFINVVANGGPSTSNCFYIADQGSPETGLVKINGRMLGSRCTNIIKNAITGYASGNSNHDFDYTYPGDTAVGVYVDGPVIVGSGAAGSTFTSTAGTPTANCTVGSLDTNTSAGSASTVLYVCYPANTWTAVTVP
jgi:hypothetical protein